MPRRNDLFDVLVESKGDAEDFDGVISSAVDVLA